MKTRSSPARKFEKDFPQENVHSNRRDTIDSFDLDDSFTKVKNGRRDTFNLLDSSLLNVSADSSANKSADAGDLGSLLDTSNTTIDTPNTSNILQMLKSTPKSSMSKRGSAGKSSTKKKLTPSDDETLKGVLAELNDSNASASQNLSFSTAKLKANSRRNTFIGEVSISMENSGATYEGNISNMLGFSDLASPAVNNARRETFVMEPDFLNMSNASNQVPMNDRRHTMDAALLNNVLADLDDSTASSGDMTRDYSRQYQALQRSGTGQTLLLDESAMSSGAMSDVTASNLTGYSIPVPTKSPKGRRATADPVDLEKLAAELDGSGADVTTSSAGTVNTGDMSALLANLDDSGLAPKSDRRQTVEADDIQSLMNGLTDDSVVVVDRRQTVDPTDMESLMRGLKDDSSIAETSAVMSEVGESGTVAMDGSVLDDTMTSVGTINTMDLMANVDQILETSSMTASPGSLSGLLAFAVNSPMSEARSVKARSSTGGSGKGKGGERVFKSPKSLRKLHQQPVLVSHFEAPVAPPALSLAPVSSFVEPQPASRTGSQQSDIVPGSAVKSCMSVKKTRPATSVKIAEAPMSSAKKNVVFGSPNVAEFNKQSPSTNFTPMGKRDAKTLFPINSADSHETQGSQSAMSLLHSSSAASSAAKSVDEEITDENSKTLEEWDRLTNASGDESSGSPVVSEKKKSKKRLSGGSSADSKRSRRRLSKLQPVLDLEPEQPSAILLNDSTFADNTISLPANLNELLIQNEKTPPPEKVASAPAVMSRMGLSGLNNSSFVSNGERTEEIELDLNALMTRIDRDHSFYQHPKDASSADDVTGDVSTVSSANGSMAGVALDAMLRIPRLDDSQSSTSTNPLGSIIAATAPTAALARVEASVNASEMDDTDFASMQHSYLNEMSVSSYNAEPTVHLEDDLKNMMTNLGEISAVSEGIAVPEHETAADEASQSAVPDIEQELSQLMESFREDQRDRSIVSVTSHGTYDISNFTDDVSYRHAPVNAAETMAARLNSLPDYNQLHFSILEERETMPPPAADSKPSQLLDRIRNLNAGARINALAQCNTPQVPSKRLSLDNIRKRSSIGASLPSFPSTIKKPRVSLASPGLRVEPTPVVIKRAATPYAKSAAKKMQSPIIEEEHDSVASTPFIASAPVTPIVQKSVETSIPMEDTGAEEDDHERTSQEEFEARLGMNLNKFFNTVQLFKGLLGNCSASSQSVLLVLLKETFRSYSLQNHIHPEVAVEALEAAWDMSVDDAEEFVAAVLEQLDRSFYEDTALSQEDSWDQAWVDTASLAIGEYCDGLKASPDNFTSSNKLLQKVHSLLPDPAIVERQQMQLLEAEVQELKDTVAVVNTLTFCEATKYTASALELCAYLSKDVSAVVQFRMQMIQGELSIADMHVDVKVDGEMTEEKQVAVCYFGAIMANEALRGPLSAPSLEALVKLNQIPAFIQQVNSCISVLRNLLCALTKLEAKGWKYAVTPSDGVWGLQFIAPNERYVVSTSFTQFVAFIAQVRFTLYRNPTMWNVESCDAEHAQQVDPAEAISVTYDLENQIESALL